MVAMLACAGLAAGQGYPSKPVRVIVALPARRRRFSVRHPVRQNFKRDTGQGFIVDHRAGGGHRHRHHRRGQGRSGRPHPAGQCHASISSTTGWSGSQFDTLKDLTPIAILTRSDPSW